MSRQSCRDDIIKAFTELMLEMPFSQISVSLIAKRAGISRTSYYRHFYTQREVLDAWLDDLIAQVMSRLRRVPSRKIIEEYRDFERRYNIYEVLACLEEEAPMLRAVLASELADDLRGRLEVLSLEILDDVIMRSQDEVDTEQSEHGRELLHYFFAAGMSTLTCDWLMAGCQEPSEELASFILSAGRRLTLRPHVDPVKPLPVWDPHGGLRAPQERPRG